MLYTPDEASETKQQSAHLTLSHHNRLSSFRDSGVSMTSVSSAEKCVNRDEQTTLNSKEASSSNTLEVPNIFSNSAAVSNPVDRYALSDLHTKYLTCQRYPHHDTFIPVDILDKSHLLEDFRDDKWVRLIRFKAFDVVRLSVSHTSDDRPDDLGFKGTKDVRFGSGTAFVYNMRNSEPCDCKAGPAGHSMSGVFKVMTVSHVVYNDKEAQSTTVEFFYDSVDSAKIVRAWGVRVCSVDVERNRSVIECRTHDLGLWQTLESARKARKELIEEDLEAKVGNSLMAVLISHPHGMCKQVSVGTLKSLITTGDARMINGVKLIDCILTYDTPTCSGTGGGPINVFGGGTTNYAFAPHCASKKNGGENFSGLGWARVLPN